MKIKQVCEMTGLTDRAIRYYIEEGLVFPAYTENYMGRRAYDFADGDVTALNHIATLRKFGFTVEEIRELQRRPSQSQRILAQVRERKQEAAGAEQEALTLLDGLGRLTDYTVPQLVAALGDVAERAKMPPEKYRPDAYDVSGMLGKALVYAAVMLAPPGFLAHWLGWYWKYHRYAAFGVLNALSILLALVPTGVLLIAWLRPDWIRRRWRAWLLCLLYLPLSWGFAKGMLGDSVTKDIRYYRVWDYYVTENDQRLVELFPAEVRHGGDRHMSIYTDSDYFYRVRADGVVHGSDSYLGEVTFGDYEIYAEWTLTEDQLQLEVERVNTLFRQWEGGGTQIHRSQQGDFTCWIANTTPVRRLDCLLFAYDESTGRVRYYRGHLIGHAWSDSPYFRTLDWGGEGGAAP